MALETATYIDGLVATNPAASDAISTADDHLRLIKATIKATFPNISGAVTKTAAEINSLASQADLTTLETAVAADLASLEAAATPFLVPSGGIIMWSGSIASIPSGWFLCDGANGTPNLRDRFVVGAGTTYAVGATGGSANAIVVSHTHTATSTVTDPGHTHLSNVVDDSSTPFVDAQSYSPGGSGGIQQGGGESRNFTSRTSSSTTGVTVATTVASTGSSGTNANLPPYYALAYIMKA
jgi:hypothetical protein